MIRTAEFVTPMKVCSKCLKGKSLDNFFNTGRVFANPRVNKDRKMTVCKDCTYKRTRENVIANRERSRGYQRNWIARNPEKVKEKMQLYIKSPKGIYRSLVKRGLENISISQQEFIDWYLKQTRECVYCGIPEELCKKFAKGKMRGRLTIDRIKPKGKYEIGNIVLACGICNFVKLDIFNSEEMSVIGQIIRKKWENLL